MNDDLKKVLSRLEAEPSISAIVRTYEDALEKPTKNQFYSLAGFAASSFLSILYWFLGERQISANLTLENLVSVALSLSGVALGLGLAGVAIYSSSLKPETLRALAIADYPKTNVSLLKMILASFVYAIVSFLKLVSVCVIFYLFVSTGSFINEMILLLFRDSSRASVFLSLMFFPIFSYYFVFAFSNLWSFVYNLHLTFVTIAAAEILLLEKQEQKEGVSKIAK